MVMDVHRGDLLSVNVNIRLSDGSRQIVLLALTWRLLRLVLNGFSLKFAACLLIHFRHYCHLFLKDLLFKATLGVDYLCILSKHLRWLNKFIIQGRKILRSGLYLVSGNAVVFLVFL